MGGKYVSHVEIDNNRSKIYVAAGSKEYMASCVISIVMKTSGGATPLKGKRLILAVAPTSYVESAIQVGTVGSYAWGCGTAKAADGIDPQYLPEACQTISSTLDR